MLHRKVRDLLHAGPLSRDATRRSLCFFAALLLGISLLTSLVPFSPLVPGTGVDPSWMYALNEASSLHMAFGDKIVSTFGPYAALFSHTYHPRTDGLFLVVALSLAAAYFFIALVALRGHRGGNYLLAALFFALATLDRNIVFFAFPTLLALAIQRLTTDEGGATSPDKSTRLLKVIVVAGGMGCGLLCLSKGSMVPYSWAMLALCLGWLGHCRQWLSAALLAIAYLAATLLFWRVVGQAMANLPGYFTSTLEIISGYTDAMSVTGDAWQWITYLLIAALTLLLLGMERAKALQSRIFLGLVVAGCYFFCFKAAFTRHDGTKFDQDNILFDGHFGTAALALLLLGLCVQVFFSSHAKRWAAGLLGLLGCAQIVSAYGPVNPDAAIRQILATQTRALDGMRSRFGFGIMQTPGFRYWRHNLQVRSRLDISDLKGNWDLYPYDQSLLLAHDVQWNPRPAFQSYFAYTPHLLQANADHLRGRDAPDNILFKVQPLDERYPAQDDGLSWPYLMGLYRPEKLLGHDFLWLQRRQINDPQRRVTLPTYLPARSIRIGQRVELPTGTDLRYARLKFSKTLAGKAMSLVYKAPILKIKVELVNGNEVTYRLIPGITEAGFLLSPRINSADQFAFAATGQLQELHASQVVAFTLLTGENGNLAWHDEVEFSLSVP